MLQNLQETMEIPKQLIVRRRTTRKDKRKDINNEKSMTGSKRNFQPVVTLIKRRDKNIKIRRELSFPLDIGSNSRLEETDLRTPENVRSSRKEKERRYQ